MSFEEQSRLEENLAKKQKTSKNNFANRFERKSWLIRHQSTRKLSRTGAIFAHIISAAAGFYGALIIMQFIPIPIPYFEYFLAITALVCLELLKRSFSDRFWDSFFGNRLGFNMPVRYGSACINILLLIVSLALSVAGTYFGANDFSPNDPKAEMLDSKIKQKKADFKDWKSNPVNLVSSGEVKWDLRLVQKAKEDEILRLEKSYFDQYGTLQISQDWKVRNDFRKYFAVFITLLAEILFECFMGFASYYDARLYRARKLGGQKNGTPVKKSLALAV